MATVLVSEVAEWKWVTGLAFTAHQIAGVKVRAAAKWEEARETRKAQFPGEHEMRDVEVVAVRSQMLSEDQQKANLTIKLTKVGDDYKAIKTFRLNPTTGAYISECKGLAKLPRRNGSVGVPKAGAPKASNSTTRSSNSGCEMDDHYEPSTDVPMKDAGNASISSTRISDSDDSAAEGSTDSEDGTSTDDAASREEKHFQAHQLSDKIIHSLEQENANLKTASSQREDKHALSHMYANKLLQSFADENDALKAEVNTLKRKAADDVIEIGLVKCQRDALASHASSLERRLGSKNEELAKHEVWKREVLEAFHRAADEKVELLMELAASRAAFPEPAPEPTPTLAATLEAWRNSWGI